MLAGAPHVVTRSHKAGGVAACSLAVYNYTLTLDTHRTRRLDYSPWREEDARSDDCADDDADAIHQRDVLLQFDIARTHAARYRRAFFPGSVSHFFRFVVNRCM